VAGLLMLAKRHYFRTALRRMGRRRAEPVIVVCVLTGHGLKDPERAIQSVRMPKPLPPNVDAISKSVGLR
jgi:threonine synthase